MPNEAWTIEEVALIVADYRRMALMEFIGQPYNKAEHNRQLQQHIQRAHGSIERKHQNISAVLRDAGCFYISGYKPLGNYQHLLAEEVTKQLLSDPEFDRCALQAAQTPWQTPARTSFDNFRVGPPLPSPQHIADGPAFVPIKRDYLEREAHNRQLGEAGETLVVDFERFRLRQNGLDTLAERVEHVAQTRGDGLGYDVLSFDTDGSERFIEVKTTAFGKDLPFYMSRNEVDFSVHESARYHLYRLFDFRKQPHMFTLNGNMHRKLQLDPVSYLARVS